MGANEKRTKTVRIQILHCIAYDLSWIVLEVCLCQYNSVQSFICASEKQNKLMFMYVSYLTKRLQLVLFTKSN